MIKTDLLELIRNGEDSKLEFKRDTVRRESLAKVLVSFLNLDGGTVLLGVEDDRTISGVARDRPDEWIADICRRMIDPKIVPILSWTRDVEPGRDILAVSVTPGPNKPYACIRGEGKAYFIRVASTSREASQEELERMFQASGRINYGKKPVPGTTLDSLDMRRLRIYFSDVLGGCAPEETDRSEWELLLRNQELMTNSGDHCVATVDGLLLFGIAPRRGLPQSGVRAVCYASNQPELAARADEALFGPMVPLARSAGDQIQERGLIEQALDFVRRNTDRHARLEEARRVDTWDYPEEVVREALLNALQRECAPGLQHCGRGCDVGDILRPDGSPKSRQVAEYIDGRKHEGGSALHAQPQLGERNEGLWIRRAPGNGGKEQNHSFNAGTQRDRARLD